MTAAPIPFPEERRVRLVLPLLQDDQVAITHHGQTTVYDRPADLHAAVLVANRDVLDAGERRAARRRAQARLRRYAAALRRRRGAALARLKADVQLWVMVAAASAVGLYVLAL